MGGKCCAFVNKSKVEMEIRVFLPPARPDRFRKIIRIKPGELKLLRIAKLCSDDNENAFHLMLFVDGVYTGTTLYRFHIHKYAKILGEIDNHGLLLLTGTTLRFPTFCTRIANVLARFVCSTHPRVSR